MDIYTDDIASPETSYNNCDKKKSNKTLFSLFTEIVESVSKVLGDSWIPKLLSVIALILAFFINTFLHNYNLGYYHYGLGVPVSYISNPVESGLTGYIIFIIVMTLLTLSTIIALIHLFLSINKKWKKFLYVLGILIVTFAAYYFVNPLLANENSVIFNPIFFDYLVSISSAIIFCILFCFGLYVFAEKSRQSKELLNEERKWRYEKYKLDKRKRELYEDIAKIKKIKNNLHTQFVHKKLKSESEQLNKEINDVKNHISGTVWEGNNKRELIQMQIGLLSLALILTLLFSSLALSSYSHIKEYGENATGNLDEIRYFYLSQEYKDQIDNFAIQETNHYIYYNDAGKRMNPSDMSKQNDTQKPMDILLFAIVYENKDGIVVVPATIDENSNGIKLFTAYHCFIDPEGIIIYTRTFNSSANTDTTTTKTASTESVLPTN